MWVITFHAMCVRMLRYDAERLGFTRSFTDLRRRRLQASRQGRDARARHRRQALSRSTRSATASPRRRTSSWVPMSSRRRRSRRSTRPPGGCSPATSSACWKRTRWTSTTCSSTRTAARGARRRARGVPGAVPLHQRGRVPGHEPRAVRDHEPASPRAHRNLMVVGDDDQSIYSWRGADIRNILEFEHDYPEATVVKLEENYRSIGTHPDGRERGGCQQPRPQAQDAVHQQRRGRDDRRATSPPTSATRPASSPSEIERLLRAEGRRYTDFAVFYRTNAQSRSLEDAFMRAGVPYQIVGGTRFFDRAEIRDVMAYLQGRGEPRRRDVAQARHQHAAARDRRHHHRQGRVRGAQARRRLRDRDCATRSPRTGSPARTRGTLAHVRRDCSTRCAPSRVICATWSR